MAGPDEIYLDKSDPGIWKALNGVALQVRAAADAAGLPPKVIELMYVRASQINGCAYCLDVHVRQAQRVGVTAQQLAVLPAWRDTSLFSDVEQAALTVVETVTLVPGVDQRSADLARARELLSDAQQSALTWAAIVMNAFNRVSILSRHPVRPRP